MNRREFPSALMGATLSTATTLTETSLTETSLGDAQGEKSRGQAGAITDVKGIRVGHYTDQRRPTGVTVVLFEQGAVAGIDVRGSAPGTRETDLLNPIHSNHEVHAILLAGGSAFGLDAATGVMQYLEEKGIGVRFGGQVIPIVPSAVLFDLPLGDGKIRPDAAAGYQAARMATSEKPQEGNVGAGAGASVGKAFGFHRAMKTGLGTASLEIPKTGVIVGALAVVNAVGDIIDPKTGKIIAGARDDKNAFIDTAERVRQGYGLLPTAPPTSNTTLGIVATNAALDKTQLTKVAQMAQDGLARTISPVHTLADGDTVFAASTAKLSVKVDHGAVGAIAADLMAIAILRAVQQATGAGGLPAWRDLQSH